MVLDDEVYRSVVSMVILGVATLGILINVTASYVMFKVPSLGTTFGFLNVNRMVADIGSLLIFGAWIGPLTLFSIFNNIHVWIYISATWVLAAACVAVFFFPGCDIVYFPSRFSLAYAKTRCGQEIGFWLDFMLGIGVVVVCLVIDSITLLLIVKSSNKVTGERKQMIDSRNRRFFFQILVEELQICLSLVIFHVFSGYATTRWQRFVCSTLVWQIAHCSTGLIVFAFNRELRYKLQELLFLRKPHQSVVAIRVPITTSTRSSTH